MDDTRQDPGQAAPSGGLATAEARARLAEHGENAIQETRVGPWRRLLAFFWGPIPWMIEIAAVLSAAAGRWEDFAVIASLLLINAGVGFWEEFKADNAIEALKQRLAPVARVLRYGTWRDLPRFRRARVRRRVAPVRHPLGPVRSCPFHPPRHDDLEAQWPAPGNASGHWRTT